MDTTAQVCGKKGGFCSGCTYLLMQKKELLYAEKDELRADNDELRAKIKETLRLIIMTRGPTTTTTTV